MKAEELLIVAENIQKQVRKIHFKDIFGGIASIHCAWKLND